MREVSRFLRWLWPALVVPGATLLALGAAAWLVPPPWHVTSWRPRLLLLVGLPWTALCFANLVALLGCYLPAAWRRPSGARAYVLGVLALGALSATLALVWFGSLPIGYV